MLAMITASSPTHWEKKISYKAYAYALIGVLYCTRRTWENASQSWKQLLSICFRDSAMLKDMCDFQDLACVVLVCYIVC